MSSNDTCLNLSTTQDNFLIQENHDNALFQTVLIIIIALAILLIVFSLLRRFIKNIYKNFPYIKPEEGKFSWIYPVLYYSDEDIHRTHGLDVLMFILFQKAILICVSVFLVYGLLVLLPVDYTSSNKNYRYADPRRATGLSIFSIANINITTEKLRITAHFISVVINTVVVYYVFYKTYQKFLFYKKRKFASKKVENFTVMIRGVSGKYKEEEIYEIMDKLFRGKVLSVHRAYNVERLVKLQKKRKNFISEYEAAVYQAEEGNRPLIRKGDYKFKLIHLPFFRSKVDAISYYEQKIEKYRVLINKEIENLYPTEYVFVTFTNEVAAAECDSLLIEVNGKNWKPEMAPQPKNIIRKNLHISSYERTIKYILILILTFFIGIFFSVPVVLAQGFANIRRLAQIDEFSFLQSLEEKSPFIINLISGILPPLIVVIFSLLLELLLRLLVYIETPITKSLAEAKFMSKFFYVQLLNVFLIVLFSGSFMSRIDSFVECIFTIPPQQLIEMVGHAISGQVNYFISYIALSIITINIYIFQIMPLLEVILSKISCRRCCAKRTDREKERFINSLNFNYGLKYTQITIHFVIAITFASISAAIVPFAFVLIFINYLGSRYFLLYMHKKRYEGNGNLWPKSFSQVMICLTIYQVIMAGVFLIKGFVVGVVFSIIFAVSTIIYTNIMNKVVYRKTKKGTISYFSDSNIEDLRSIKLRNAYWDTNLVPYSDNHYRRAVQSNIASVI